MKKIKRAFSYIAGASGFSPVRIGLTVFYTACTLWGAVLFTRAVGNYPLQMLAILMFGGGIALAIRSFKRLFDKETVKKLSKVASRVAGAVSKFFSGVFGKLAKTLGLEKKRLKGEEVRDFIFREKEPRRRRFGRYKNPHSFLSEDNSIKVRYIFTEYMFGRIRGGYRMLPRSTPSRMRRELAGEDVEKLLFDTYEIARYSGGREIIENDTVDELETIVDKRKKKKRELERARRAKA